jgi:hypothetical protein
VTTYCSISDLDSLLEGFVSKYYGTFLDDGDDLTIGTQFSIDQYLSFNQANEWLSGISSLKQVPIGTQPNSGNYPYHVRILQGNLMIYNRLKGRHYGEFTDSIPGWINVYINQAQAILKDIRDENVVFDEDTYQGEQGIGIGSFVSHSGAANWFTNWETGIYTGDDFPRTYVFNIVGTGVHGDINESIFRYSNDGGASWQANYATTSTDWLDAGFGLQIRWEQSGTAQQLCIGDALAVKCVPLNIPVKSGNIRYITFKRG